MEDDKARDTWQERESRKDMLRFKAIITLLGFVCCATSETIQAQTDTLSFIHITDLHLYFEPDTFNQNIIAHRINKGYDVAEENFRSFMESTPYSTNCNFIVATGDLIDFDRAETTEGKMLDNQVEQFCSFVREYPQSMYYAMGNHEFFSYSWKNDHLIHNQNLTGMARASWVRNCPCFEEGTYYSLIYQLGNTSYRLIFLDNGFYKFLPEDSTEVPYIDKPQLYWLNAQMDEREDDIEIICMHIPFNDLDENTKNELYSSLLNHPSCKLIISGHHHKNQVSYFPSKDNAKLVQVQTGALVRNNENWRLIRLTENSINVSEPGKLENEISIPVD